jgi:hypothetical protein
MALSEVQLQNIERFLLADPAEGNVAAFRSAFPGVTFTRCDALDMRGETPFRSYAQFDLYLIDARDHCVQLTADPVAATGIVLAQLRGGRP